MNTRLSSSACMDSSECCMPLDWEIELSYAEEKCE
jgi:hypothetical protein